MAPCRVVDAVEGSCTDGDIGGEAKREGASTAASQGRAVRDRRNRAEKANGRIVDRNRG